MITICWIYTHSLKTVLSFRHCIGWVHRCCPSDYGTDLFMRVCRPPLRCMFAFHVLYIVSWLISPQYSTEGKVKEPNLAAEAGRDVLSAVTSYARGDMGGVLSSAMGLVKAATGNSQKAEQITKATRTSPADVVSKRIWGVSNNVFFFLKKTWYRISRFLGVVVKILRQVLIPRKLAVPDRKSVV